MSTGESGASRHTILTAANLLTCIRLVLTLPFLYLVLTGRYGTALAVFFVAGITDFADGYVARRFNQRSSVGRLLDPIADKVLTTSAFVAMAVSHAGFPSIPGWLAVAVVGRDTAIVLGAAVVWALTKTKDFPPAMSGKITTFAELSLVTGFLLFHTTGRLIFVLPYLYLIVALCVAVSGIEYLLRGLEILRQHRKPL